MWVRRVIESTTIHEKQFHACDNNEIAMKIEMVLVQDSMYQNNNKRSLKLRRQRSYKAKHKKCQKCNTRHENQAYPKTVQLNVPTTSRCSAGCHRCKVDVRNELYNIHLMRFDQIEVVTCMP